MNAWQTERQVCEMGEKKALGLQKQVQRRWDTKRGAGERERERGWMGPHQHGQASILHLKGNGIVKEGLSQHGI